MKQYQYTLEPYKGNRTRHECPACGKRNTFSLYIDTENGEHVHTSVGRCNREDHCGYHLNPKQYFEMNGIDRGEDWKPSVIFNGSLYMQNVTQWSYGEMYAIDSLNGKRFMPLQASYNTEGCEINLVAIECRDDSVTLETKHYGSNEKPLSN